MRIVFFAILPLFLLAPSLLPGQDGGNRDSGSAAGRLEADVEKFFPGMTAGEKKILFTAGRIDRNPESHRDFRFLPSVPEKGTIIESAEKTGFNTAVESVFLIRFGHEQLRNSAGISDRQALLLSYRVLAAIETLEGITYYSVSHRKERPLFTRAEIISGRIDTSDLPVRDNSVTALIEDTTFGSNIYIVDYSAAVDHITMKMSNREKLTLGFIPVTGRGKLVFNIIAFPSGEGIILYCSGTSATIDSAFIRNRIGESVYNRVTALFNWFSRNAIDSYRTR